MKILITHDVFSLQKYGGISRYFSDLIQFDKRKYFMLSSFFHKSYYLKKFNIGFFYKKNNKLVNKIIFIINNFLELILIYIKKPDYIHYSYYRKKIYKNIKSVTTVYDLIEEKFYYNENKKNIEIKKNFLLKIENIICISKNTKIDLLKYYPELKNKKIEVIYLGYTFKNYFLNSYNRENIILYVGNKYGYKNFDILLQSYISNSFLKKNYQLVIFGGEPTLNLDKETYNLNIKQMYGDDKLLSKYYQKSKLLVYTSKYEGFGLPILESICHNCPVLAGSHSSIKELFLDYIHEVNLSDYKKFSIKLLNLLKNTKLLNSKNIKFNEALSKYTLSSTYLKTIRFYKSIQ